MRDVHKSDERQQDRGTYVVGTMPLYFDLHYLDD